MQTQTAREDLEAAQGVQELAALAPRCLTLVTDWGETLPPAAAMTREEAEVIDWEVRRWEAMPAELQDAAPGQARQHYEAVLARLPAARVRLAVEPAQLLDVLRGLAEADRRLRPARRRRGGDSQVDGAPPRARRPQRQKPDLKADQLHPAIALLPDEFSTRDLKRAVDNLHGLGFYDRYGVAHSISNLRTGLGIAKIKGRHGWWRTLP